MPNGPLRVGIPFEGSPIGRGGKFDPVLAGGIPVANIRLVGAEPRTIRPLKDLARGERLTGAGGFGGSMPFRNQILARSTNPGGFFPASTGSPGLLGTLVQGGLDILGNLVQTQFQQTGSPVLQAAAGGNMTIVGGAVAAAGGAIIGTVIRITRAGWAAIPAFIKQLAVALGLTVAFTDVGLEFPGGGGAACPPGTVKGLSCAQLAKIDKFQSMTSAGVPPGIAARATGIGRKRRRGISAFELRGFSRISHLLSHVGMVPRGLRGARPKRGHHHS